MQLPRDATPPRRNSNDAQWTPRGRDGVMNGRILVIKLGALGDFVQALGPMAAIRRHHKDARLTLLTTAPYAEIARATGWFSELWIDDRPSRWRACALLALRRRLGDARFARVYDLQTSRRSGLYFRLMARPFAARPEWSGIARGCSHPHANPRRDFLHTIDRQAEQLAMAGVSVAPRIDLSWLEADVSRFALPRPYVLFAPAGAAHRPAKRWPAEHYGALAARLLASGRGVALLGVSSERATMAEIRVVAPGARDLSGAVSLAEIAALARGASGAVGNDTGPMHLIAGSGCPSVVLFSDESDPALCAPRAPEGARPVAILRRAPLAALAVEDVFRALRGLK